MRRPTTSESTTTASSVAVPRILTRCSGCATGITRIIGTGGYDFERTPRDHAVNMGARGILCGGCMRLARIKALDLERELLRKKHGPDFKIDPVTEEQLMSYIQASDV